MQCRVAGAEADAEERGWALTCGEPLLEGVAVDLDLDGVAVPGLRAGEGFGGRRRWREGDEARVEQEPPSGQTR